MRKNGLEICWGKLKNCEEYLIPLSKDINIENIKSSMEEITDEVIKCMEKDVDFILVNYPYPDILGNSGNIELATEGLKLLDEEDNPVEIGEEGELCFDVSEGVPPGLFKEYFKDPVKQAQQVHDGYYPCGDTAWVD